MIDDERLKAPREDWLRRWRENNIGWHHQEFNAHLTGHWHRLAGVAGRRVLVPLCGKSRDMVWLAEQGHTVLGVELSPLAVAAFFAEQGLTPERRPDGALEAWRAGPYGILCGDIFELTAAQAGDIGAVYDRASLVALNPVQRTHYAALLGRLLPAGCQALLVAMDYPQHEMQGPPYSVPEREVRTLFGDAFTVQPVHALDLLKEGKRYGGHGLSSLWERIYLLRRNPSG